MELVVVYMLIPVVLVLLRKYRVYTWGKCKSSESLEGKVFIVTGANSGIGKETVRELARRKARVIMACRDMIKAAEAIQDIRKTETLGELIPMELDLASFESVRSFARSVLEQFPKIDVLINNAGVYYPPSRNMRTRDDFEIHLGVNFLGPFLLTYLLVPRLRQSAPSRVVNVCSSLFEKHIKAFNPKAIESNYVASKTANVLFSTELARRTAEIGIHSYAVCPGFTYTNLFRSRIFSWYQYILLCPVAYLHMRTASQGAQTVLYCAISKEVEGETGLIYRDCRQYKPRKKISPKKANELWNTTKKIFETPNA